MTSSDGVREPLYALADSEGTSSYRVAIPVPTMGALSSSTTPAPISR